MTKTMPIIEVRKYITTLPEQFEKEEDLGVVAVTRRGKPVLALMPWDHYEALTETLEILGDDELMAQLRKSISELNSGEAIPWENVRQEMGG